MKCNVVAVLAANVLFAAVSTLFSLVALAQESSETTIRIGFVDASKVLEQAPQAELARKLLEGEFGSRDKALVDAQQQIRELEDQLNQQTLTLGEAERRELEQQVRRRARELKRGRQEFREDFNIRRNEELRSLQRLVYDTIVATAQQQGFDLVVNDAAVIYAAPSIDITEQILKQLAAELEP